MPRVMSSAFKSKTFHSLAVEIKECSRLSELFLTGGWNYGYIHGWSILGVSLLQDGEDQPESIGGIHSIAQVHHEAAARVGPGSSVAIGEENICVHLLVMCAGQDVVGRQRGRTQKLGVNGQGADGQPVAVDTQVVKVEVGRDEGTGGVIEEQSVAGMTIIITALGLANADLGQLGVGVKRY